MEKSIDEIIKEIETNEEKIKTYQQKINRSKQKISKAEASLAQQERRDRTHRFCEIGGAIESDVILGRPLTEEDVPLVISFLADQEARGKFLSNWLANHSKEETNKEKINEEITDETN